MEYDPKLGVVLPKGIHTLFVTYYPENEVNYTTATAAIEVLVREKVRARPQLIWHDKTNLEYPQRLRLGVELDAQCVKYEGKMTYTPPPGTILPVGVHSISVDFECSQTGLCHPASKTISVTVHKVCFSRSGMMA